MYYRKCEDLYRALLCVVHACMHRPLRGSPLLCSVSVRAYSVSVTYTGFARAWPEPIGTEGVLRRCGVEPKNA